MKKYCLGVRLDILFFRVLLVSTTKGLSRSSRVRMSWMTDYANRLGAETESLNFELFWHIKLRLRIVTPTTVHTDCNVKVCRRSVQQIAMENAHDTLGLVDLLGLTETAVKKNLSYMFFFSFFFWDDAPWYKCFLFVVIVYSLKQPDYIGTNIFGTNSAFDLLAFTDDDSETSRPARGVFGLCAVIYKAQKRRLFDGSFVFPWASIQWHTTCCFAWPLHGTTFVHIVTVC